MRPSAFAAAVLALCGALSARAQTITTTDALGQTVVEEITIDPLQGLPTTNILETLTAPTTATTPAQDQGQQGPVGAPPGTTAAVGGATPYTYTTTDANGDTIAVVATFTPTFTATGTPQGDPPVGTVLNFSSWKQSVGTNTVAAINSGLCRLSLDPRWLYVTSMLCAGLTGGAWLAFA
ncbi:hypothetical protein C8Q80DRAFT_1218954 [Daedaleopsis nitida]|nr:hypothetical protein C8Q80DRAFT_1218954 [Daedaleopsis nitida]